MRRGTLRPTLVLLLLLVAPASAHAGAPRWLASAKSTMTASVTRSDACGTDSAGYRISARTTQPIPVRKKSPAAGIPQYVYASFSAATRVRTSAGESVETCAEGEGCGGSGTVKTLRPRYTIKTIHGARLKVDIGSDTPEPFFIPDRGCNSMIAGREGLLPRRFKAGVLKRVPYRLFSRNRFHIRIAAKDYPVSVVDTDGARIRGTGSFSMTFSFRPYRP